MGTSSGGIFNGSLTNNNNNTNYNYNGITNSNHSSSSSIKMLRYKMARNKKRANLSFFIVIMFFGVFGVIVFMEMFLIDERGRGAGVMVRHGFLGSSNMVGARHRIGDRSEYDDNLQNDDYIAWRGGFGSFDDNIHAVLRGPRVDTSLKFSPRSNIKKMFPNNNNINIVVNNKNNADRLGDNEGLKMGQTLAQTLEAQLPPYPVELTPKDAVWQNVSGAKYKYFVYSAFYEQRRQQIIRVIGATKTRIPERTFCRLWYRTTGATETQTDNGTQTSWTSISVLAKVSVIRENWNLKYSACYILCPIPKNATVPESVSIINRFQLPIANHLLVVRRSGADKDLVSNNQPERMAVCVKPFHFNYNRVLQLIEFIELYQILGFDHFLLYNHTISKVVDCTLRNYVERNVVTILSWELNLLSQEEIRTEGQFAAFNDCLYRTMYKYSYVAFVDVDEFIIPRHNDTIPQLISWLKTRSNSRTTASYSFQNAFFYMQWPDDPSLLFLSLQDQIAAGLSTIRKTRRRTKLHPHKQRSKFICRPEHVVEVGNHFIWEFIPGYGTLNVPQDSAIMHHYRVCEFGGNDCVKSSSIVDKTAYKYKDQLINRLQTKLEELKQFCGWKHYIIMNEINEASTLLIQSKDSNLINDYNLIS